MAECVRKCRKREPLFATLASPPLVPQGRQGTHVVKSGDRLDLIAAKYLGDPLMFWLLCDANGAIRPNSLIATPGSTVAITMPQGVPGAPSVA